MTVCNVPVTVAEQSGQCTRIPPDAYTFLCNGFHPRFYSAFQHLFLLDRVLAVIIGVGSTACSQMKIHKAIIELADNGRAIILISSDLPELVGLSDRMVVMRDGHLISEMQKNQLSEESVLLTMNGELG